jgi:probable phosphoglycerate mutase
MWPQRGTQCGAAWGVMRRILAADNAALMSTDLLLIRHGETDWNRELRFQGQIDIPLNATGHEQAQRLGQRLADVRIDHIVCSDLLRTRQTAEPAARQLGLPVQTTPALREQHFGVAEGLRGDEVQARHPEAWAGWLRFQADFSLPGEVAARHPGQTVLVVTHGGVLDMVWRTVRGLGLDGPRQSQIPNAGINRVRLADPARPEALDILDWADVAHLDGLGPQPTYDQTRHLRSMPSGRGPG